MVPSMAVAHGEVVREHLQQAGVVAMYGIRGNGGNEGTTLSFHDAYVYIVQAKDAGACNY